MLKRGLIRLKNQKFSEYSKIYKDSITPGTREKFWEKEA
jgi:hypothetical protein